METRKITIISTTTQTKKVINTNAETLAELKSALTENHIDYTDMAFYEGISRTELYDDTSILPKDVPYTNKTTGETINTNELVFMLTKADKKIKSGISTRESLYKEIKEMGLQNKCKEEFGRNFTQCSSKDLEELIEKSKHTEECTIHLYEGFKTLVKILYSDGLLNSKNVECIYDALYNRSCDNNTCLECQGEKSSYTNEEIADMFKSLF